MEIDNEEGDLSSEKHDSCMECNMTKEKSTHKKMYPVIRWRKCQYDSQEKRPRRNTK